MESAEHLEHLRGELAAFRACLDGDLTVPVRHCGEWTLFDLAEHVGGGNVWAAGGITDRHGRTPRPAAPKDPAELREWFDGTCATLLAAVGADPSAEAWTFHPPHTVGFWRRRRALETVVHRWDAEHALGATRPLDPALASDGVSEVFDTMAPRQIGRGRAREPQARLRVAATDTGDTWSYGPDPEVAAVTGTAENLLLLFWGRLSPDDPSLAWTGDRRAVALHGLVP